MATKAFMMSIDSMQPSPTIPDEFDWVINWWLADTDGGICHHHRNATSVNYNDPGATIISKLVTGVVNSALAQHGYTVPRTGVYLIQYLKGT